MTLAYATAAKGAVILTLIPSQSRTQGEGGNTIQRGRHRLVQRSFGAIVLLFCAAALVARTLPLPNLPILVLAAGAPYTSLAALGMLVVTAYQRNTLAALLAGTLTVALVSAQVMWYYVADDESDDAQAPHTIRVISSNLRKGQADALRFVRIAASNADVVAVSELTPNAEKRLRRAGIDIEFPYSHVDAKPRANGVGLWSRFPLKSLPPKQLSEVRYVAARVNMPGSQKDPIVASLHVISPLASDRNAFDLWRNGIASADVLLSHLAQTAGTAAVIVGGDFNSTPDMRQFRDLVSGDYRDAVEQTGAGFTPTFPSNRWFPPVITIDHVLVRRAAALTAHTVDVPGSDHRALVTTVSIRY